jgi:hypothetical protein
VRGLQGHAEPPVSRRVMRLQPGDGSEEIALAEQAVLDPVVLVHATVYAWQAVLRCAAVCCLLLPLAFGRLVRCQQAWPEAAQAPMLVAVLPALVPVLHCMRGPRRAVACELMAACCAADWRTVVCVDDPNHGASRSSLMLS